MTTKKSTTQKSHISLQRAAELAQGIRDLQDNFELLFARANDHQTRIATLEDRIAFLTKQSSDAFCKADLAGRAVVTTREEMDKRSNATAEKFKAVEATLRTFNDSLHNHEKRLRELASEWVINKAATGYVTNPACRPRDPQWVVMGYNSERNKVEVHGPFTYAEAERFRNDADYSGYAILPLED